MNTKQETQSALDLFIKYQDFFKEAVSKPKEFKEWLDKQGEAGKEIFSTITLLLQTLAENPEHRDAVKEYQNALATMDLEPNKLAKVLATDIDIKSQKSHFDHLTQTRVANRDSITLGQYISQNQTSIQKIADAWYTSQGKVQVNINKNRDYLRALLKKIQTSGLEKTAPTVIQRIRDVDTNLAPAIFIEKIRGIIQETQQKPSATTTTTTTTTTPSAELGTDKTRFHPKKGEAEKTPYGALPSKEQKNNKAEYGDLPPVLSKKTEDTKEKGHYNELPPSGPQEKAPYGDLPISQPVKKTAAEPAVEKPSGQTRKPSYSDLPGTSTTTTPAAKEQAPAKPSGQTRRPSYSDLPGTSSATPTAKEQAPATSEQTRRPSYSDLPPTSTTTTTVTKEAPAEPSGQTRRPTHEELPPAQKPPIEESNVNLPPSLVEQKTVSEKRKSPYAFVSGFDKKIESTVKEIKDQNKKGQDLVINILNTLSNMLAGLHKHPENPNYFPFIKKALISTFDDLIKNKKEISDSIFTPTIKMMNDLFSNLHEGERFDINTVQQPKKLFLESLESAYPKTFTAESAKDVSVAQLFKVIEAVKDLNENDKDSLANLRKDLETLKKMSKAGFMGHETNIHKAAKFCLQQLDTLEEKVTQRPEKPQK